MGFHAGRVSDPSHPSGAGCSRVEVRNITDMMFTGCESDFEHAHSSKLRRNSGHEVELYLGIKTMNHAPSMTSTTRYGRKLVKASITGIRSGQDSARGEQSLSALAAEAARGSLVLAAVGACIGLLRSQLKDRRNRPANAVAFGILGSAIGFVAGFGWKTRKVTSSVAHSTARELRKARDEHWLERNPIDYA